MSQQPNERISQVAQVITRIAGAGVFVIGLIALGSWTFHKTGSAEAFPLLLGMKANTALAFALAGISLWLSRKREGPVIARRAGRVLALGVIAIGAITLSEFSFHWFSGFDEWLVKAPGMPMPGRMSYLTAINFCLTGLGLLIMDAEPKRGPQPGQFFALTAIMVCLLAVVGYIIHMPVFYGETTLFPGTRMSGMTTVSFLVLATGILCARIEGNLMRVLVSRTDGGLILRRLLLLPVVVPLAVGFIPVILRHFHMTNPEISYWMFSFADILTFTLIFCWTAVLLYRVDLQRHADEDRLKAWNVELEKRVEERTGQLLAANRELRDEVAERRHAEEQVRKLNANLEQRVSDRTEQINTAYKELESFSYSVSHDLRAPLRAIGNYSSMLLEENPQLSTESRTYLESAQRNVQKMQQLIDDLLAFSRVSHQQLQKQTVSLDEIARQCFAELQPEAKDREINLTVRSNLQCRADPALIKQLMVNLLSNAIKFTRRRGVAMIEVGSMASDADKGLVFFVRDNGAGFDMARAHKLFAVFQRLHRETEYEGTGLGLAIVQNIVNRHGGRVWTESEPDKGATFFFTLPD
jgi:signal transduction histidine kinase